MTDDRMSEGSHIPIHFGRGGPSQSDRELYDPGRGASLGDMYDQRDGPPLGMYQRGPDGMLLLDIQMLEAMHPGHLPAASRVRHEEEIPDAPAGNVTTFFFG